MSTTPELMEIDVVASRQERLRTHLAEAPFDAFLAVSPANVQYASGYRSMSGAVHGRVSVVALATVDRTVLAGSVSDSAPALDQGIDENDFVAYGRFYFESEGGAAAPTQMCDNHADLPSAVISAVHRLGLENATIGLDEAALDPRQQQHLERDLPQVRFVGGSDWASGVRARKLPAEVALLRQAAILAEDGITAAIESATPGTTERELAAVVASVMVSGHCQPRFVVVTSGERSALSDCFATDRRIEPGDLVRFDVGGILDGYWSDIGRTAVVGEPTVRQRRLYQAILAGEQGELDLAAPGVPAEEIFATASRTVESAGLRPYRRHHCGHGIGLEVYEPPIVSPGVGTPLEEGMTFCLETPYYEIGWGGMMVEDTVVITADGCRMLNASDRSLRVIPA